MDLRFVPTRDVIQLAAPLLNDLMGLRFIYGNDDDEFVAVLRSGEIRVFKTDYQWLPRGWTEHSDAEIRAEWGATLIFDHAEPDGFSFLRPSDREAFQRLFDDS